MFFNLFHADNGFCLEDQQRAMADRDGSWESQGNPCCRHATEMMMMIYIYIYVCVCVCVCVFVWMYICIFICMNEFKPCISIYIERDVYIYIYIYNIDTYICLNSHYICIYVWMIWDKILHVYVLTMINDTRKLEVSVAKALIWQPRWG